MRDSIIITIVNETVAVGPEDLLRPYAPPPAGAPFGIGVEDAESVPLAGPLFGDVDGESRSVELFCPGAAGPDGAGPVTVTIEPGNAFGDGRHATTWHCLRFLVELLGEISRKERGNLSLLDAGTGTGILAITASRLGVGLVDAVEVNPHAAECAARNIRENSCSAVALHRCDIASFDPGRHYDIVLANLVTDVILENLGALTGLLGPRGTLIASGISDGRDARAKKAFLARGLRPRGHARHDGWCGYMMTRA